MSSVRLRALYVHVHDAGKLLHNVSQHIISCPSAVKHCMLQCGLEVTTNTVFAGRTSFLALLHSSTPNTAELKVDCVFYSLSAAGWAGGH